MVEEGALPEQVDKVMVDFGYPIGPFATADLSGLDIGYDSRQRRAAQNPNYRKTADRRRDRRGGAAGPEDRGRLVPLREGRPHARIPTPRSRASSRKRRPRWGSRSGPSRDEEILRRLLVRLGQRGLQDPRRGQGLPRQRHRRDVAQRLRLPALPRRADVLGRRHRGRRGLPPDRRPGTSNTASAGPPRRSCAASPRPTPPSAKPNPAGRCRAGPSRADATPSRS